MRAAIDSAHSAFTQAIVNLIFAGQRLAEQGIVSFFEGDAIGRAQRGRVRVF